MARNEGRGNGLYGYSDHVCRPVIIDQYGRKQPIVNFSTPGHNTDGYVTKKETIVEHVYTPMVTEYKYSSSSMEDEPYKDYGINNGRPLTYVHTPTTILHTPVATEYKYSSPAKVDPYKDRGVSYDKWRRPSSPVYDRPAEVEEFITKVQTEVSQPTRTTPFSGSYWRNAANPTEPTRYGGEYRNFSNNEEKTGGNNPRIEPGTTVGAFARPTNRPLTTPTNNMGEAVGFLKEAVGMSSPLATTATAQPPRRFIEPPVYPRYEPETTKGAFARPTDRPLTAPTNNMGEAVGFLKEAIATTTAPLPPSRFTEPPVSAFPKRESYMETIDSREASRRYARPVIKTGESYSGTISSAEALKKYGGTFVP